ncbi:hypothetical protein [Nocardia sp. NPDC058705]|uniref:hypothetical protein n=1 Tax=Nocardia sp. NPDC058705 TaxID=3346609 RepID=UPI0036934533
MSDSSAGQGYSSQDDGLTSYPQNHASADRIPQPPMPQAYGEPMPPAHGQPPAYGQPMPPAYGQSMPSGYGQPSAPMGVQSPYPVAPYPVQGGAAAVDVVPRVVPQSVQIAFYVMLAGAVVTLLSMAYTLTTIDQVRSDSLDASGGALRGDELDWVVYGSIGGALVGALITVGLWVWMAFVCRAGKNWGRITGTVFFGINALFYLVSTVVSFVASTVGIALVFGTVTLAIGLAAVILLWNSLSSPYFAPRTPPGYQAYPGYPPPY